GLCGRTDCVACRRFVAGLGEPRFDAVSSQSGLFAGLAGRVAMVDLQSPPLMRQMPLDLGPQSLPGLDEFVLGDNAAVLDCLRRWPEPLFSGPPGAYLWGPSGSGKTHLLRAMMPRALALGHGVIWVNAQGCQMWDAAQEDAPTWALLDDCQRLDGHLQHLAFNLFIEAAGNATAREGGGPLYLLA